MLIVKNKIIPFGRFSAVTLFCLIFTRAKAEISDITIRHETIHWRQIIETTVLCAAVIIVLHCFGIISIWWLSVSPAIYYLLYALCWVAELALPPYNRAYGNICFESEAYYNADDVNYLKRRRPFAFLKYISNRKYPYPR